MRLRAMLWLMIFLLVRCCASHSPPKLIWAERFDNFDLDTWSHLVTAWGGGNDEFQYYRNNRTNSFVKDGFLHIRPTLVADEYGEYFLKTGTIKEQGCNFDPCSISGNDNEIVPPIFSARVSTMKSFAFKYGVVEVRAKMPRGDWMWPAIWLLPKDWQNYGGWPSGGEIDMSEIRANKVYTDQNNVAQGIHRSAATMHFGTNLHNNKYHLTHWPIALKRGDFSDDFHVFGMEWTNKSIKFLLDGEVYGKVEPPAGGFYELGQFEKEGGQNVWKNGDRMAPFDKEFYIILNVAVGGRFFPDGWKSRDKPRPWSWSRGTAKKEFWSAKNDWYPTWDRPEMLVDHILVYGYE